MNFQIWDVGNSVFFWGIYYITNCLINYLRKIKTQHIFQWIIRTSDVCQFCVTELWKIKNALKKNHYQEKENFYGSLMRFSYGKFEKSRRQISEVSEIIFCSMSRRDCRLNFSNIRKSQIRALPILLYCNIRTFPSRCVGDLFTAANL